MPKNLIVKDNALINASYNLDLIEQRLILLAIVQARKSKESISEKDKFIITASDYAKEFNVSIHTIQRDIEELTLVYPLVTVRGRYGGGVKVEDWYHPGRKTLSPVQAQLLKKLATSLNGQDLKIMNSIFVDFSQY